MPFRKKNSKYWHYDFQVKGSRFFGSCGTEDFQEAKAVEAEERVKAAKSGAGKSSNFTIEEVLGTYYTDICENQASAHTTFSQSKILLTELSPTKKISSLTNRDLMGVVVRMRATRANATVNRHIELLSRALKHMAIFYQASVPTLDYKAAKTREPKERIRFLTDDEEVRLFEHLRADLHPMVQFALMTGARQSAIYNLQWKDIGDDITFINKGGGTYQIPVSRPMRALLSTLPRSEILREAKYVHVWRDRHGNLSRFNVNNHWMWSRAVKAAEIHDFRFHDLRHTFATRMLRQTNNLKLVSELLGHSDVTTTARYAHVLGADKLSALNQMGSSPAVIPEGKSKSPYL